jgi:Glycosyl hydrolase family 59
MGLVPCCTAEYECAAASDVHGSAASFRRHEDARAPMIACPDTASKRGFTLSDAHDAIQLGVRVPIRARGFRHHAVPRRDRRISSGRRSSTFCSSQAYGASLQLLKLEIGRDGNSSDGAEPSIEHTVEHINCNAGYKFAIAEQAVAINPQLLLYGLQWWAPGWGRTGRCSPAPTSATCWTGWPARNSMA